MDQKWTRNGPVDRKLRHDLCVAKSPSSQNFSDLLQVSAGLLGGRDRLADAPDGNGSTWIDHPGELEPPSLGRFPRLPVAPAVHLLQLSLLPPGS